MRRILIIVVLLATLRAPLLHAQEHALGYINGIFNTESSADGTRKFLVGQYRLHNGLSKAEFDEIAIDELYYNKSGCPENGEPGQFEWQDFGCLLDIFEAGVQSGAITTARQLWELEDTLVTGSATFEIAEEKLQQASDAAIAASEAVILLHTVEIRDEIQATLEEIPGRLALVAHSQGNYFANDAVDELDRVGIVSVGSPAPKVTIDGPHVMAGCDILRGLGAAPSVNAPSSECGSNIGCQIRCHSMATYITGALTEDGMSRALLFRAINETWQLPPANVPVRVSSVHIDQEVLAGQFIEDVAIGFCASSLVDVLQLGARVRFRIFGEGLDLIALDFTMDDCADSVVAPSNGFFLWREAECVPTGSPGRRLVTIGDGTTGEMLCAFEVGVSEPDPPPGPLSPRPIGAEIQLNNHPIGLLAQATPLPDVAALPSGGTVVVWAGDSPDDPTATVIFGRVYNEFGQPIGPSFVASVGFDPSVRRQAPSVAVDVTGNFLVAWTEDSSVGTTFQEAEIRGRWFDDAGQPLSSRFTINLFDPGIQRNVDVAAWGPQQAVAVWENHGSISMQPLGPNGPFPGAEFDIQVSQSSGTHIIPRVDAAPDGEIMVAWAKAPGTIRARRFASDGTPLGGEIVDISAPNGSTFPDVQVGDDGHFVISWGGSGSFVRPYAGVVPISPALQLPAAFSEAGPSLGLDHLGNIVVVGRSTLSGNPKVVGQRFDISGGELLALEEEFVVNSLPSNSQSPRVAVHPGGEFAVTWYSCCSSSEQPAWLRTYELALP